MTQHNFFTEMLFSYGTLQQTNVQEQTFKRTLTGTKDKLCGYKKEVVKITDPEVIRLSGKEYHTIVTYSGNATDEVEGTVFAITPEELKHADNYEVSDYKRVQIQLTSGTNAWVYIAHK